MLRRLALWNAAALGLSCRGSAWSASVSEISAVGRVSILGFLTGRGAKGGRKGRSQSGVRPGVKGRTWPNTLSPTGPGQRGGLEECAPSRGVSRFNSAAERPSVSSGSRVGMTRGVAGTLATLSLSIVSVDCLDGNVAGKWPPTPWISLLPASWPGSEGGVAGGVSQPVPSNGISRKEKNRDGDRGGTMSPPVECSGTFISRLLSDSRLILWIGLGSDVSCG